MTLFCSLWKPTKQVVRVKDLQEKSPDQTTSQLGIGLSSFRSPEMKRQKFDMTEMSQSMIQPTKWPVHPTETQISLGICPVWSESLLSAWKMFGSLATHTVHSKRLIRLGGCPGWSESSLGAQVILLVLSCSSSNITDWISKSSSQRNKEAAFQNDFI